MATRDLIEPLTKEDDPKRWLERFDAVASWHNLVDEKKSNALVALMGAEVYGLVADAILPDVPANKSFDELKATLLEQMRPKRLAIAERYDFNQVTQGQGTVSEFLRKLRYAAAKCEFGPNLDERLRDQFVFGIASKEALKKMLTLKLADLTLKKATDIAVADEVVRNTQENWSSCGDSAEVHRVQRVDRGLSTQVNKDSAEKKEWIEMPLLWEIWSCESELLAERIDLLSVWQKRSCAAGMQTN